MPNSCEEYYRTLAGNCQRVLSATFQTQSAGLQAVSHAFITDLGVWHERLVVRRPEAPLFTTAMAEYQFALLAVVQGQYRQAFMALRLSLELLLGGVWFSANELELRFWLRGERDLVWGNMLRGDNGVLSPRFVRAFCGDLSDEAKHYQAMAEKVYRECSEYVHGNVHASLDTTLVFQEEIFQEWHAKAGAVRLVSTFALWIRYSDLFDADSQAALEPILLDSLGHLEPVRARFGAAVEVPNA